MAEVWEGRDEVLNRPVAVKVLLSHLAADPLVRERFRREAVTAARLVHPGIVAIFDAGIEVLGEPGELPGSSLSGGWSRDESDRVGAPWPEGPSTAYIVMELVPGETLRDLMARAGPLPARSDDCHHGAASRCARVCARSGLGAPRHQARQRVAPRRGRGRLPRKDRRLRDCKGRRCRRS